MALSLNIHDNSLNKSMSLNTGGGIKYWRTKTSLRHYYHSRKKRSFSHQSKVLQNTFELWPLTIFIFIFEGFPYDLAILWSGSLPRAIKYFLYFIKHGYLDKIVLFSLFCQQLNGIFTTEKIKIQNFFFQKIKLEDNLIFMIKNFLI